MHPPLRIGIAGLGTVGAATLQLLRTQGELLRERTGRNLAITAVAFRDAAKQRHVSLEGIRVMRDAAQMAQAEDVEVVLELIGGAHGIAHDLVRESLRAGKHVVTANKALIATHGAALAALAEAQGVTLAFEAAVAGGIPVLSALRTGLAANRVTRVAGILNGTCNYMLSTMEQSGQDFDTVLREAQSLGYAEADPAADVDGIDTAHKLAILASLAFGTAPDFAAVYCEGIRHITPLDIHYAARFGYRIKLLGIAALQRDALLQQVTPALVPLGSPLAAVNDVFNAIAMECDAAGNVVMEGRGAGGSATASAVLSDVVAIARGDRFAPFTTPASLLRAAPRASLAGVQGAFYLRLRMRDEPGVLSEITQRFAQHAISVRSITQPSAADAQQKGADILVITHITSGAALAQASAEIAALSRCLATPVALRILA